MSFSQTAMLVALNISCFSGRRDDKKISGEVHKTHGMSADAGRYEKALVAKRFLDPVTRAATALRTFHYENTLPWLDKGLGRVLPSAHYLDYRAKYEELRDVYMSERAEFVRLFRPVILPDSRKRLNGSFCESDFPADIESKFSCGLTVAPIPDAQDFRANVGELEREALKAQWESTLESAERVAMHDLWSRVQTCVEAMATKLTAYERDSDGKVSNPFRDSLVGNLRDMAELLPKLNFAGDAKLESVRLKIESELTKFDADVLRESETIRTQVANHAQAVCDDIADRMREFMI